jgi:predicted dehydrogenase
MSQLDIGIIGAGWWAVENHIPVLKSRPDVNVAAVCRLGREALQRMQEQFDIPFGTEDYRELLAHQKLDGVIVSSPHHLHFEHASAALERGIAVLCEKPMVLHAAQARELRTRVQARGLHFLIPYGWNYTELAAAAKAEVDQGKIGNIEYVHCHMASAHRDLFSGEGTWFAEESAVQPEASTWSDPARGGGFAHGQLTHALALLFYITGLPPAEVFALMSKSKSGADLSNAIVCRFTNGATGTFGGSATMPPRSTYQVDIRLFGSAGMLLLDIERPRLEIHRNDGSRRAVPLHHEPGAYSCVQPLHTFIDLIQGRPVENRSSVLVGTHVVEVLDAAFRSANTRRIQSV